MILKAPSNTKPFHDFRIAGMTYKKAISNPWFALIAKSPILTLLSSAMTPAVRRWQKPQSGVSQYPWVRKWGSRRSQPSLGEGMGNSRAQQWPTAPAIPWRSPRQSTSRTHGVVWGQQLGHSCGLSGLGQSHELGRACARPAQPLLLLQLHMIKLFPKYNCYHLNYLQKLSKDQN